MGFSRAVLLCAANWCSSSVLSLMVAGAVGCSSTRLQDDPASTDDEGTKTSGVSSVAPGAPVPSVAAALPKTQLPRGPSLPGDRQPLQEPPPPSASVLAQQTKALIASAPAGVAVPAVKQVQLPPTAASLPVVAPEVIAKQDQYLKQWEQLRPSLAALPPEEQEQRRAALKQATVGK